MSIRTYHQLPPLAGGVSQQPAQARLPTKVTAATNALFDVSYGFAKRPGTEFNRKFTNDPTLMGGGVDYRIKVFQFARDEEYFVVWGRASDASGTLPSFRIFRIGGNEAAVTISGAATTYMDLNGADGSQLRFRQVGDHGYIINTTVNTALTASTSYTPERSRVTFRDAIAFSTTVNNYVRTESDDNSAKSGYYQYTPNPSTLTYGHMNFQTIGASGSNPWMIHDGYWDDNNYGNNVGFRIAFRRQDLTGFTGATFTTATGRIVKTNVFTNYTYQNGDMVYVSSGTGFTAGWYPVTSKVDNSTIVISGGPGADNADTACNVTDAVYSETNVCRIGKQIEVNVPTQTLVQDGTVRSMHDIAYQISLAMRNAGASNACCAWVPQMVGGAFQITGPYRGSGALVYAPSSPVQTVSTNGNLTNDANDPFYNGAGTFQVVAGSGTLGTAADTDSPESRWTRVAPPSQATAAIDATKMPHVLLRTAANTFTLGAQTWKQRASGNSTTAPGAALFTNAAKINDIVWFKERAMLVGGAYVAMSKASDETNFWPDDVTNIVDSDTISRIVTGTTVSLDFAVPFRESIVLFSQGGVQYQLTSTDVLSPSTAAITPTTHYQTSSVQPMAADSQVFFVAGRGDYGAVFEYYYDDLRVASTANEVTTDVPRYLSGSLRSIVTSPNNQIVLVLPVGAGTNPTIYAYGYFYNGDRKVQSAWGTWTYADTSRICDITAWDTDAALLIESTAPSIVVTGAADTSFAVSAHGYSVGHLVTFTDSSGLTPSVNGTHAVKAVTDANNFTIELSTSGTGTCRIQVGDYFIEKQPLSRQAADSGYAYSIHSDRQMSLTSSYGAGVNTWTLPATPTVLTGSSQVRASGSTINTIVLPSGTVLTGLGYSGNTITYTGSDYSAVVAVLGYQPSLSVTLSRPYLPLENTDVGTPLQLNGVSVDYSDTCGFTVTATQTLRTDRTRTVDNSATPTTGTFETFLQGSAKDMTLTISDATPKPVVINTVGYEIEYAPSGITTDDNTRRRVS